MIPTTYFDYFFATERQECEMRETAEFAALDDDAWQEEMRYATDDVPPWMVAEAEDLEEGMEDDLYHSRGMW